VTKAGRGGPCEINHVLPAGRVRARNDLLLAYLIERGLTAQFSGRLDCLYNRVHVVIGAQMVGLDHGRIAPVSAGEPYLTAARRLNQRRRDRETFFRRRSEPGRRFRRCDRNCSSTKLMSVGWLSTPLDR
jgi:hypothetical protein